MLREVCHTTFINAFPGILLLFIVSNSAYAYEARWEPIPLTTVQQNNAGVAGGEGFQKVMCIVYAPSDPDIIYFGTDTAQVW